LSENTIKTPTKIGLEKQIEFIHSTGMRVIKIEKYQRFCLKCGKILPTKIKQNYTHNCEKPDFLPGRSLVQL